MAFIDCIETDTQVAIWTQTLANDTNQSSSDNNKIIIVFRGTETNKWKDIVTDLNITPTLFHENSTNQKRDKDAVMVHSGFYNAYKSVRDLIMDIIMSIVNSQSLDSTCWDVCCTGHSLGGALASLCAYDLMTAENVDGNYNVCCYTYGSPRVGNDAFVKNFKDQMKSNTKDVKNNNILKESYRFFNKKDLVATVPDTFIFNNSSSSNNDNDLIKNINDNNIIIDSYNHIGIGVLLCSDTSTIHVGREHRFDNTTDIDRANEDTITNANALFSDVFSGEGVKQHMEDYYFDVIQNVLLSINNSNNDSTRSA